MLLGALAILGGGAGAVLLKRRHDSLALGAEECAALAEMAVEAGQFDEALTWNVRARAASPRSARLWLDEGFYLERLDRPHDALAAYRAAAGLGAVADACLHEARLRLALGALAEAEDKLVDALHASPASLLEVEDGGFEALLRRPRVRTAMDAARRALGSPDG
jgi:tetratricopeptide (TPR) repeat protein